jgi:hypothetical protein
LVKSSDVGRSRVKADFTGWGKIHFLKGTAFSVCVRTQLTNSVPEGRLRITQDSNPGLSRLLSRGYPALRPGKFSAVPDGTGSSSQILPSTGVLGYFQPSLRDSILEPAVLTQTLQSFVNACVHLFSPSSGNSPGIPGLQRFVKFDIFGSFWGLAAQRGWAKGFFFIEKGTLASGTEAKTGP